MSLNMHLSFRNCRTFPTHFTLFYVAQVFINGVKFCAFKMRSNVEDIRAIQVNGDVFIHETLLMKRLVCLSVFVSLTRMFS